MSDRTGQIEATVVAGGRLYLFSRAERTTQGMVRRLGRHDRPDPGDRSGPLDAAEQDREPRAITQGAQMKNRFAAPVASAATALVLLGACSDDGRRPTTTSDDGPTTLAKGDVTFAGSTRPWLARRWTSPPWNRTAK